MMNDAREIPAPIQWHEGMLLAPQHFQQAALRQEALLNYHLNVAAPFYWGIRRLKIDTNLLMDGVLRILELEAVFPDGLVFFYQYPETSELECDLTPFLEEMKRKPVTVFLVVPVLKSGFSATSGQLARYDSLEGRPVADENTGETELSIPRLQPKVSLLISPTLPQKYSGFPLVQCLYRNENYTLNDFIPPVLTVSLKSALGTISSGIAQKLREKALILADKIHSPTTTLKGPMILETKMLIQNLVGGLIRLETILNSERCHPFVVYLALTELVGSLAGVGRDLVPPTLEPYDHNNPRKAFEQVQGYIRRMLDEGILESHTAVPFDFENGAFNLKLEKAWVGRYLILGVQPRSRQNQEQVRAWMDECLIGSQAHIESMKERRILGAPREQVESAEELVPMRGTQLYKITVQPGVVDPEETLQILNPVESDTTQSPAGIVLYVRNQPHGQQEA